MGGAGAVGAGPRLGVCYRWRSYCFVCVKLTRPPAAHFSLAGPAASRACRSRRAGRRRALGSSSTNSSGSNAAGGDASGTRSGAGLQCFPVRRCMRFIKSGPELSSVCARPRPMLGGLRATIPALVGWQQFSSGSRNGRGDVAGRGRGRERHHEGCRTRWAASSGACCPGAAERRARLGNGTAWRLLRLSSPEAGVCQPAATRAEQRPSCASAAAHLPAVPPTAQAASAGGAASAELAARLEQPQCSCSRSAELAQLQLLA